MTCPRISRRAPSPAGLSILLWMVGIRLPRDWFGNEHVTPSWPMRLEGKPGREASENKFLLAERERKPERLVLLVLGIVTYKCHPQLYRIEPQWRWGSRAQSRRARPQAPPVPINVTLQTPYLLNHFAVDFLELAAEGFSIDSDSFKISFFSPTQFLGRVLRIQTWYGI